MVIDNAGGALLGDFDEFDPAQMRWLMGINFWGVVHGSRAFLPLLERQQRAHIVTLSSIFGIIAPAGQTAYAASKFAVRVSRKPCATNWLHAAVRSVCPWCISAASERPSHVERATAHHCGGR